MPTLRTINECVLDELICANYVKNGELSCHVYELKNVLRIYDELEYRQHVHKNEHLSNEWIRENCTK